MNANARIKMKLIKKLKQFKKDMINAFIGFGWEEGNTKPIWKMKGFKWENETTKRRKKPISKKR